MPKQSHHDHNPGERQLGTAPDDNEPENNEWMLLARCRGSAPTEFFPSDGVGVEQARKVCADCPVRVECLEYALRYRIDHGVWGGCSERERRRILKRRREARQAQVETTGVETDTRR